MKRLVISICILFFIALLSVGSVVTIKLCNKHLDELVENAEQAYLNKSGTQQALDELEEFWDGYYLALSYFSAEPTMADMSRAVKKLPDLLRLDSDDFLAELNSIRHWAKLLYDTQFPDLSSIF